MTTYSSRFFTYAPLFNLKFCFTDHARSPQNTIQYQTPSLWHGTLAAQPQHHHHHHHITITITITNTNTNTTAPPCPCNADAALSILITLPFTSPLCARCASAELQSRSTTTTILRTIIPSSPFYVDFPSRCYLCCTYFHLPQFIACISLYGNIILPSCRNTRIDLATGQLFIPILGKCYNILSLCFPSSSSLLVLFVFIAVSCICLQFYFVLCFIY